MVQGRTSRMISTSSLRKSEGYACSCGGKRIISKPNALKDSWIAFLITALEGGSSDSAFPTPLMCISRTGTPIFVNMRKLRDWEPPLTGLEIEIALGNLVARAVVES